MQGKLCTCGTPIDFIELKSTGRWHPIECDKLSEKDFKPGDRIVTVLGEIINIHPDKLQRGEYRHLKGFRSHFSVCPDANLHRRP